MHNNVYGDQRAFFSGISSFFLLCRFQGSTLDHQTLWFNYISVQIFLFYLSAIFIEHEEHVSLIFKALTFETMSELWPVLPSLTQLELNSV